MSQSQNSNVARPANAVIGNLKKGQFVISVVDPQLDDNLRLTYQLTPNDDPEGKHAITRIANALTYSANRGHSCMLVKDPESVQRQDGGYDVKLTCLSMTTAHTPFEYHAPLPREGEDYLALCKQMKHEPIELIPGSTQTRSRACINVLKPIRLTYRSDDKVKV